jgi:RHS repeat-associated protein
VRDPLVEGPTDKVTSFVYDETGNVLSKTKRSGTQTIYTYDLLNRMTNAQYASTTDNVSETVVYDNYGNKQSVSNADVTYNYEYDLKNRPTKKTDNRVNKNLQYTYDYAGNILTKTNYDGSVTDYRYDSANRLVSLRNPSYLEVSYNYDGAGRLLNRILSNGARTDYAWDDGNRLSSITNLSADGSTVNSVTFDERDRLGNISTRSDDSGTTTVFTYDALYRLTDVSNYAYDESTDGDILNSEESYVFDKVGNRLIVTLGGSTLAYVPDADNRLKEIHQGSVTGPLVNSFDYDNDGNLAAKRDSTGAPLLSFVYDAKGRVKNITSNGISQITPLQYDPYDYRIMKYDRRGAQTYLLEGEHLEGIMSGYQWQAKYLRGVVIDEVVNGYQYDTDGHWTNFTFHHDALQSVTGLSGHDGGVLQTIKYGPYGDKTVTSGSDNLNFLHFTGREEDIDSGLYYFRARYYDPAIGRFISEDPKGFKAGVNFYAYTGNNPINYNDPLGLARGDWYDIRSYTDPLYWNTVKNDVMSGAARQRAFDALKAEVGIIAGAGQLTFAAANRGLTGGAIGSHGVGNYLGSIGDLSNVIDGGNRNWNVTKTGYEALSDAVLGKKDYGTTAFYATDLAMAGYMAMTPIAVADKVNVNGVELDRYRNIPSEVLLPTPIVANDAASLYLTGKSAADSAAGGYLIYPNKTNLNMINNVYAK